MGSETMAQPAAQALSKRQRRRQGSHPSTSWQQQPRIKSASARAKAYITYAGLSDSNNDAKKPKTIDPDLDLNSPEVKFGRLLGSTDQRKRHLAVKSLQSYLRTRSSHDGEGISELDLLKLWKGLWYTLYMCDKVPVQDRLSEVLAQTMWCLGGSEEDDEYAGQVYLQMDGGDDVAVGSDDEEDGLMMEGHQDEEDDSLIDNDIQKYMEDEMDSDDDYQLLSVEEIQGESSDCDEQQQEATEDEKHCCGAHLVSLYIATFLRTVRREWGNVDKHRVDKFYTAVRLMLSEAYKYMAKRYWNMGIVRLFNDVIYEEALSRTPNGLRYHLIDICVHELAKVNKEASVSLTEATFLDCLEPFFAMIQRVEDKNVQKRVVDSVMMKFLNEFSFVSDVALSEEEEDKELIFQQVHVGTVAKFIFEIASDGDTDVRYRKGLYEMHKTFVRKIRAAGRDVDIDDCEEEEVEDNEEEIVTSTEKSHCVSHAEHPIVEGELISTSKKDKKKKKRKAKEAVESSDPESKADECEPAPTTPTTTDETTTTESSTKSKKRKRKKAEKKEADAETTDTTDTTNPSSSKKKKKQKSDKPISKGDVVAHKTDLSPNSSDGEGQGTMSASKRVSFGAHNHSKSHKASMKALKTLTQKVWSTANRTPDKSILLKRPETEVKKSKSQKKKRKST